MSDVRLLLVVVALLITAHQLPAPIVEPEEKPTPAPEQSKAPKPKHSIKPEAAFEDQPSAKIEKRAQPTPRPAIQGPARFAGTWTGKINQGVLGHVKTSLTIDTNATSIQLSRNLGGSSKPLTVSGNTASWKSGAMGEIAWTLTPNSDGQTAQVTMKGLMLTDSATFRRGAANVPAQTSSPTRHP
jgi:hypothetical protein